MRKGSLREIVRLDDPEFHAGDPHPAFRRLREEAPVYWYDPGRCWIVSSYELVREVALSPDTFVSSGRRVLGELSRERWEESRILINTDEPEHDPLRKVLTRDLTPRAVSRLEPLIQQIVEARFDRIRPSQTFDFVTELARPIPLAVIMSMLGLPLEDTEAVRSFRDKAGAGELEPLRNYLQKEITRRRAAPGDDLLSVLIRGQIEGAGIDESVIIENAADLLDAGSLTVEGLLAGGTLELAQNPDQFVRLREDPSLIPGAVEEMLRCVSPLTWEGRNARRNSQLGGCKISSGDFVVMLFASANRDSSVWPEADRFDVTRTNAHEHLAFGFGSHLCAGLHITRTQARLFFSALVKRFSNLEVAGTVRRLAATNLNTFEALPLRATG